MYGQCKLNGHLLPLNTWCKARTATQPIAHIGACINVVSIIVLPQSAVVDARRCAGPLRIIACSLKAARIATDSPSALDVSHASTKPDGIGRDDTVIFGAVGYHHTVLSARTFVKVECP